MFEVGKKYKYCGDSTIAKCVFAGKTVWVLVDTKTGQEYTPMAPERWEECKEPRTITRWVNVYEERKGHVTLKFGAMFEDETKARASGCLNGAIATIPITYTEPL